MKGLLFVVGGLIVISLIYGTITSRGGVTGALGLDSGGTRGGDRQEAIQDIVPGRITSPYAGLVELRRARARDEDPEDEYIEIRADRNLVSGINVTGWTVKSAITGKSFTIPEVALIPPYPNTGRSAIHGPVILESRHELHIVTWASPVRKNFRTSVCTGYLGNTLDFEPNIPRDCPAPEDEDLWKFGIDEEREEDCVRKIRSIGTCKDPSMPDEDEDISRDCREYIGTKVNYNTCIELHAQDADFFGDEWYVYIESIFDDMWDDEEDAILLLDNAGRVVDVVEYD